MKVPANSRLGRSLNRVAKDANAVKRQEEARRLPTQAGGGDRERARRARQLAKGFKP